MPHSLLLLFIPPPGTAILLKPGVIAGGSVTHECPLSRSVGYFLEPVIMLAPFAKKPIQLTLRGITTDEHDLSVSTHVPLRLSVIYSYYEKVDIIRTVTLPHLQLFGISDGLELRVCLQHTLQLYPSIHLASSDKKARKRAFGRWRSAVPMSHR